MKTKKETKQVVQGTVLKISEFNRKIQIILKHGELFTTKMQEFETQEYAIHGIIQRKSN